MWETRNPILYCENNIDDIFLTKRLFKKLQIPNPLFAVSNGIEAVEYLEGKGPFSDRAVHPFLSAVITDLKMPVADGFHVLQWFMDNSAFAVIPVVVWSSSELHSDIKKAYDLGAHCYLSKSGDVRQWETTLRSLFQFWQLCEFPKSSRIPEDFSDIRDTLN